MNRQREVEGMCLNKGNSIKQDKSIHYYKGRRIKKTNSNISEKKNTGRGTSILEVWQEAEGAPGISDGIGRSCQSSPEQQEVSTQRWVHRNKQKLS